jgi:hypothetical protein
MGLREDQIAQAKAMKTPDGKRMFSDEQIAAHIKQLDLQKTFSPTIMGQQQEPETQKLRSALQGTTFKFADEAEAYIRSLGGEDYDDALRDIRLKIKNYEKSRPVESGLIEAGASIPISLAMSYLTGGGSTSTTTQSLFPSLARVAGVGAAQGGLTGAGGAEGGAYERLVGGTIGTATGGVLAPATYLGMKGLGNVVLDPMIDFTRRKLGDRGAKIVETEVQRIQQQTGLEPDEIVTKIANGEILAENPNILGIVRAYASGGGDASRTIREALTNRPAALRNKTVEQISKELSGGAEPNVLKKFAQSEVERTTARNALYNKAYDEGGVITEDMLNALTDAMQRSPSAYELINKLSQAQLKTKPFFTMNEAGEVTFIRPPTIKDMEIARRGLKADINKKYNTAGEGDIAKELQPYEENLRGLINKSAPAVGEARAQAASDKLTTSSFDAGKKAFTKSPDQVQVEFEELVSKNPEAVSAYRAGIMAQLRNKMSMGSRTSMMANLESAEAKEGQILRIIYPQDKVDDILKLARVASQSQKAAGKVLGGSDTAQTLLESKNIGINISPQEVASVFSGDAFTTMRVVSKFVEKNAPNLSPEQKQQVARILVSEDPSLVSNALRDQSGMAMLQQKLQAIGNRVARTSGGLLTAPATTSLQNFLTQ